MKTAIGLHFSRMVRAARVVLLIAVVAALAMTIAGMWPRADQTAPAGSEQTSPGERQPHYNFPTYA